MVVRREPFPARRCTAVRQPRIREPHALTLGRDPDRGLDRRRSAKTGALDSNWSGGMAMNDHAVRLNEALAGRYTIEREIGAGGMATVYLAHDLKHDRRVAVKVLHADLARSVTGERF